MKPIKLSICIPSMPSRHGVLTRLLNNLSEQPRLDEVQVLVNIDEGQIMTGAKRNALVAMAEGAYVVHIDDDDDVHPAYAAKILEAIDSNPGVDAIAIRGRRVDICGKCDPIVFDYGLGIPGDRALTINSVLWRSPGHLCPVRADIAKRVPFPHEEPEDIPWVAAVAPHITTLARAGEPDEILYYYLWDSVKVPRWSKS